MVAVDICERHGRRRLGDQAGRFGERNGQHILERIRLRAVVAVELVGGAVVSGDEVDIVVAVHVPERQRRRGVRIGRDRQGGAEPLPRGNPGDDLGAGVEIELVSLPSVAHHEVESAVAVDVADGQRRRRLRGGKRARGRQAEGAGAVVEVETIHRVPVADDQVEVTVAIDVAERDGGRRIGLAADVGAGGEPEPGMGRCVEALVQIEAIPRAVVADDQVGKTVAVDVPDREGRRRALIGGDVLAAGESQPGDRRADGLPAAVQVDPVPLVVVADHQVDEPIAVHVRKSDRRRSAGVAREQRGRGQAEPAAAVVQIEIAGLGRSAGIAGHQVEIAVTVDVGESDGGGGARVARHESGAGSEPRPGALVEDEIAGERGTAGDRQAGALDVHS